MKFSLAFLFISIPILLIGKMPANPYFSPTLGFEDLIPFSLEELKIIKNEKIYRIYESGTHNQNHYFTDGRLDSSISKSKTDNKYKQTTIYKYDYNDNLILRKSTDNYEYYIGYDSLAYNKNRIVRYYAYSSYKLNIKKKKSKRELMVHSDLFYVKTVNNLNILIDSTEKDFLVKYHLDSNNNIVKRVYPNRIDTMESKIIKNDTILKTWYFKQKNDSIFNIGSQTKLFNQMIVNQVNFSMYDTNYVCVNKLYKYDNEKHLVQIYNIRNRYTEKFYTYNNKGLKQEIVTIESRKPKSYKMFVYN